MKSKESKKKEDLLLLGSRGLDNTSIFHITSLASILGFNNRNQDLLMTFCNIDNTTRILIFDIIISLIIVIFT